MKIGLLGFGVVGRGVYDIIQKRDDMEITVHGNADRVILTARFDNLGKGASGAAIQNMNILLGCDQTTGLVV